MHFEDIKETKGIVILFTNSFILNESLIENTFEKNTGFSQFVITEQVGEDLKLLCKKMNQKYFSDDLLKKEMLEKYLELLLLEIVQVNEANPILKDNNFQRFYKFKQDLKKHFKAHKNVGFYAENQFTSPKTLNSSIRKIVDKSAKQFINEYIILLAKRMLINSDFSQKEIAYILGFDEPTNFTKFFKNIEKVSPSVFQKSYS